MTQYELLLDKARKRGVRVTELPFVFYDGLVKGRKIGIRKTIETEAEKADVLAEEIAHFDLTVGDILDQSVVSNRKQELKARHRAYDMRIGLHGIVSALEFGCSNSFEAAEYLGCSQKFFEEALNYYKAKHGIDVEVGEYTLIFDPLNIIKDQ